MQQKTAYADSGVPENYYIGNVGQDGIEDFQGALSGRGDDSIESIRKGSYPPIFGLTAEEAKELVRKAEQALVQSSSQLAKGDKQIRFDGRVYNFEKSAVSSGIECTDFMSPKDCLFMFNLCDPVMCPASRCDAGGNYPVSNVIQTGIIGSIFLCLPNAAEGIVVPVCLSGIHAGLERYVSILKAHRDCLKKSLDTG